MKIGIDIREIQPFPTGIGRYFCGLISGLQEIKSQHQFCLLANPRNPLLGQKLPPNWEIKVIKSRPKSLFQQISFPRELDLLKLDLLLINPFGYAAFMATPYVIVILDMINQRYPQFVSWKARLYERLLAKRAANRALLVLTDSEFSKEDIHHFLGISVDKIRVTMLAADPVFRRIRSREERRLTRERYHIPGNFILYVGNRRPHKNLKTLLLSYARLQKEWGEAYALPDLVIVGDTDTPALSRLEIDLPSLIKNLGVQKKVILTGHIGDEELACLYQEAMFLAHPALIEGFGLTPLEAMQSGCPVLASNAASIPEVVDEAAVLIDPVDIEAWSAHMLRLLKDEAWRVELGRRGLRRAQQFNWQKTAQQTLDLLRDGAYYGLSYNRPRP